MGTLRRALGGLLLGIAAWLLVVPVAVLGPGAAASVAMALAALLAFLGWTARAFPFAAQGRPRAVAFGPAVAAVGVAVLPTRSADVGHGLHGSAMDVAPAFEAAALASG